MSFFPVNSAPVVQYKNYVLNPKALNGTSGWVTYKDANQAVPENGTAGTAALTFTRTTTSPLEGPASFLLTTTAADLRGEGASYDFTIDSADLAKVLSISFDYAVDVTTVTGDFAVYLYDVTNALVIQPTGYQIQGGISGAQYRHIATFQTASNSSSYRLIIHRAVATAQAVNLKIDNIIVGPQVVQYGAPITDWGNSFAPTITNGGTTGSNAALWRRVGDSMQIQVRTAFTGAGSASTLAYALPSGYSIDTTKLPNFAQYRNNLGSGTWLDSGTDFNNIQVIYNTATTVSFVNEGSAAEFLGNQLANGDNLYFEFMVPIQGWSSSVQMSNDTDTRVVALNAFKSTAQSIAHASFVQVTSFDSAALDTHAGFNPTTGVYTVQVPGIYSVKATLFWDANVTGFRSGSISKNGSLYQYGATANATPTDGASNHIETLVSCNAGDTLSITGYQTSGGALNIRALANATSFSVNRISGPSAIAASETVAAKYNTSSTQSIANETNVIVNYDNKIYDTHGAVTTGIGTWKFTAPVSGIYSVKGGFVLNSNAAWGVNERPILFVQKGGTGNEGTLSAFWQQAAATQITSGSGSIDVRLNAGEYIQIMLTQNSGASLSLLSDTGINQVSIVRVGN